MRICLQHLKVAACVALHLLVLSQCHPNVQCQLAACPGHTRSMTSLTVPLDLSISQWNVVEPPELCFLPSCKLLGASIATHQHNSLQLRRSLQAHWVPRSGGTDISCTCSAGTDSCERCFLLAAGGQQLQHVQLRLCSACDVWTGQQLRGGAW